MVMCQSNQSLNRGCTSPGRLVWWSISRTKASKMDTSTNISRDPCHGTARCGAWCVFLLAFTLMPALTAAQTFIDLSTLGSSGTHNGALFLQGDYTASAGTGNLDPFVRIKEASSAIVAGVNTGSSITDLQTESGTWTTELLLSTVPQVDTLGHRYRRFFLDINQTKGGSLYGMHHLRLFIDNQPDLHGFNPSTDLFSSDDGSPAVKVYDLDEAPDGNATVKLNYSLEAGSGEADMMVFIPDMEFGAGPECNYGQTGCTTYLYLYSAFGDTTGGLSPNDDGFEEWATAIRPFIQLSKTASGSVEETHTWTIDKSVSPAVHNMFTGDDAASEYTIAVDETVVVGSGLVSGVITIHVPSFLPDGDEQSPPAEITSLSDVFRGVSATITGCTVPFTVTRGNTVNCNYTLVPPDASDGFDNVVTAEIADANLPYADTVAVTFVASVVGYEEIDVTDTYGPAPDPWHFTGDGSVTYTRTFTCDADEGTHDNTATITQTGADDDASVSVTCYIPEVTKTVNTAKVRAFNWTLTKSVTPEQWDMFDGDTGTSLYTLDVTRTGLDSGFVASGAIAVYNPAPMAAEIVSVSDLLSLGTSIPATVDCGGVGPYTIASLDTLDCTYTAHVPDETSGTNTATATLQNYSTSVTLVKVASGTTTVDSDPENVVFNGGTTTTTINAAATLNDTNGPAAAPWSLPNGTNCGPDVSDVVTCQMTYEKTFACDADDGPHDNVATLTLSDSGVLTDTAAVLINCYSIEVAELAEPAYQRFWDWTLHKVASEDTLTLAPGQTFDGIDYDVQVNAAFVDSLFEVTGMIYIRNLAPLTAELLAVTDTIETDGMPVAVDCGVTFPYMLVPPDTLECSFGPISLPNNAPRISVANVSMQNHAYTYAGPPSNSGESAYGGSSNIGFGPGDVPDPAEADECMDLTDTMWGDLGIFCASEANPDSTYEFHKTLTMGEGPQECGYTDIWNIAELLTNDSATNLLDSVLVVVYVPCPEGCTLTLGYWKTHNASFWGGAPPDSNWQNIGNWDLDGLPEELEGEGFFLSGMTWFEVFWSPPQGNPYFNLAHQYMAAVLNSLNNSVPEPTEVQDALNEAAALFMTYTPAQASAFKGKTGKEMRQQFIDLAGILGSFNEGDYEGFPHCDEDDFSNGTVASKTEETESAEEKAAAATEEGATTETADASEESTGVIEGSEESVEIPTEFAIGNYPNPFNPVTTLRVELPEADHVTIQVFDALGRRVATVIDKGLEAGIHEIGWNAQSMPSGTYYYVVRSERYVGTGSMMLIK